MPIAGVIFGCIGNASGCAVAVATTLAEDAVAEVVAAKLAPVAEVLDSAFSDELPTELLEVTLFD